MGSGPLAIITLGATGLAYATSQESGHVPAIECDIVDMTGAGDALTCRRQLWPDQRSANRPGCAAGPLGRGAHPPEPRDVHPDLSLEHLYDQLQI